MGREAALASLDEGRFVLVVGPRGIGKTRLLEAYHARSKARTVWLWKRPGTPVDREELLEAGWPGQRLLPDSAVNRLYASIATIRKLGLGEALRTEEDGYLLDPAITSVADELPPSR